jgi:hypothetical protein
MLQTRDPAYDATNAATWALEDRQSYGLAGIVYGVVIGYVRIASANTKGLVLASTHTPTTITATEEIGPCLRRGGEDYDRRRVSGKHTVHVFDIENDWARLPNPPSTLYSDRQERSSTRESTSTRKNRQIPTRKHKASLHSDKSEVTLDRRMQRR